jgi:hypothetical protein
MNELKELLSSPIGAELLKTAKAEAAAANVRRRRELLDAQAALDAEVSPRFAELQEKLREAEVRHAAARKEWDASTNGYNALLRIRGELDQRKMRETQAIRVGLELVAPAEIDAFVEELDTLEHELLTMKMLGVVPSKAVRTGRIRRIGTIVVDLLSARPSLEQRLTMICEARKAARELVYRDTDILAEIERLREPFKSDLQLTKVGEDEAVEYPAGILA